MLKSWRYPVELGISSAGVWYATSQQETTLHLYQIIQKRADTADIGQSQWNGHLKFDQWPMSPGSTFHVEQTWPCCSMLVLKLRCFTKAYTAGKVLAYFWQAAGEANGTRNASSLIWYELFIVAAQSPESTPFRKKWSTKVRLVETTQCFLYRRGQDYAVMEASLETKEISYIQWRLRGWARNTGPSFWLKIQLVIALSCWSSPSQPHVNVQEVAASGFP